MPLTLIKETGAGLVDANSYADVDDGNAYYDGHLYGRRGQARATRKKPWRW